MGNAVWWCAQGLGMFLLAGLAHGQACYQSSIVAPSPFLGNHDEVVKLSDGSLWQVQYEYLYLYEYYPSVTVCPSAGKLIVDGKPVNVMKLGGATAPGKTQRNAPGQAATNEITVVAYKSGCRDYFIADGPQGYYLLEWYGGYDPSVGDTIIGNLRSYGFKDVFYPKQGRQGRVYVDDYLLSRNSVLEKYREKCE